ncbi:MAG: hypothetical protein HY754_13455 [Nitrospirae bacterium]|nr:hypothetical protein [Nitrospirota bacterium]
MAGKDIIMLHQRELKRLHVIHRVLDEALKQVEAAEILELSDRQIRRVVNKVIATPQGVLIIKLKNWR